MKSRGQIEVWHFAVFIARVLAVARLGVAIGLFFLVFVVNRMNFFCALDVMLERIFLGGNVRFLFLAKLPFLLDGCVALSLNVLNDDVRQGRNL